MFSSDDENVLGDLKVEIHKEFTLSQRSNNENAWKREHWWAKIVFYISVSCNLIRFVSDDRLSLHHHSHFNTYISRNKLLSFENLQSYQIFGTISINFLGTSKKCLGKGRQLFINVHVTFSSFPQYSCCPQLGFANTDSSRSSCFLVETLTIYNFTDISNCFWVSFGCNKRE